MACLLTTGRGLPCKSGVGGLKAIYFIDFGGIGVATDASSDLPTAAGFDGIINNITGTPTAYKFDIKGNSTLETAVNSSRENGTTFYESTLTLTLPYLDAATNQELKLLAYARPQVIVEDYNGNKFLVGLDNGADVNGGTIVSGAAMGDLSGFTLTMVAMEKFPPPFMNATSFAQVTVSGTQITPN